MKGLVAQDLVNKTATNDDVQSLSTRMADAELTIWIQADVGVGELATGTFFKAPVFTERSKRGANDGG